MAEASLMRRRAAMEFLEVSDRKFRELVRDGLVRPRRWNGKGRGLYVREELERLLEQMTVDGGRWTVDGRQMAEVGAGNRR